MRRLLVPIFLFSVLVFVLTIASSVPELLPDQGYYWCRVYHFSSLDDEARWEAHCLPRGDYRRCDVPLGQRTESLAKSDYRWCYFWPSSIEIELADGRIEEVESPQYLRDCEGRLTYKRRDTYSTSRVVVPYVESQRQRAISPDRWILHKKRELDLYVGTALTSVSFYVKRFLGLLPDHVLIGEFE
ncbi:MAG: hypothetical protein HYU64_00455 [Armatimonadetes bacterium]|nr:hypothetical protein [Armatimonadota bacterium]